MGQEIKFLTDLSMRIRDIIEPTIEAMGFELVRIRFGGDRKPVLQIMAERPDGTMDVDACADISREVSALLDVEDPIAQEYALEVSSPGIDRPLTRAKDFQRWQGFDAKVELDEAVNGQRRFSGRLDGLEDGRVKLHCQEGDVALDLGHIVKAKLILTGDLLKAAGADHAPIVGANG